MMPRSCSLVLSGGGSRAAHEPPKQHLMKRLVSVRAVVCWVLDMVRARRHFGESFSRCPIYMTKYCVRYRPSDANGALRRFFDIFFLPASQSASASGIVPGIFRVQAQLRLSQVGPFQANPSPGTPPVSFEHKRSLFVMELRRGLQPWRVPTCIPSPASLTLSTRNQKMFWTVRASTKEPLRPSCSHGLIPSNHLVAHSSAEIHCSI
jgi:hypothetical protein